MNTREMLTEDSNDRLAKLKIRFPMLSDSELSLLERQFEESEFWVKPFDAEDNRVEFRGYNQDNKVS
jgi:hypothetical protein